MRTAERVGRSGFTLVEIIVVVVILGLLATMVAHNVLVHADDSKVSKATQDVQRIAEAMKIYLLNHPALPADGLQALVSADEKGRVLLETLPDDPWKNPYVLVPGTLRNQFAVVSRGPDGAQDTEDDIRSPPEKK